MKPTKRSIWPARTEAGWRPRAGGGRPRGMSQVDWFYMTPRRDRGMWRGTRGFPANGWRGGRDRWKPRKTCYSLWAGDRLVGGVDQFSGLCKLFVDATRWEAWITAYGRVVEVRVFGHRRDAKRWVEAHPLRVRA